MVKKYCLQKKRDRMIMLILSPWCLFTFYTLRKILRICSYNLDILSGPGPLFSFVSCGYLLYTFLSRYRKCKICLVIDNFPQGMKIQLLNLWISKTVQLTNHFSSLNELKTKQNKNKEKSNKVGLSTEKQGCSPPVICKYVLCDTGRDRNTNIEDTHDLL